MFASRCRLHTETRSTLSLLSASTSPKNDVKTIVHGHGIGKAARISLVSDCEIPADFDYIRSSSCLLFVDLFLSSSTKASSNSSLTLYQSFTLASLAKQSSKWRPSSRPATLSTTRSAVSPTVPPRKPTRKLPRTATSPRAPVWAPVSMLSRTSSMKSSLIPAPRPTSRLPHTK